MFMLNNQSMPQSAKAHMDSQFNLLSELSKQLLGGVQRINEVNIQIAQSMMQDSMDRTREVFGAENPYDVLSTAASQAQPAADRMRHYQQQMVDIAARTQADLAQVAERCVPETSRTASALAEEVARTTSENIQRAIPARQPPGARPEGGKTGVGANVH